MIYQICYDDESFNALKDIIEKAEKQIENIENRQREKEKEKNDINGNGNGNDNGSDSRNENESDSAEGEKDNHSMVQHVSHTRGLSNAINTLTEEDEEEEDQDDDVGVQHQVIERDKRLGQDRINVVEIDNNIGDINNMGGGIYINNDENNENNNNSNLNELNSKINNLQQQSIQAVVGAVENDIYTVNNPSFGL